MNPLYPLQRYRWFKTRIEIWGPRLGSVEALAGLRVRFVVINSFDRLKNCQSNNQPRYNNWCYKCCCWTSTDLLASFFWEGKPLVDVSSCGPSGRLLMWRLCWGRSLQLAFYARQSYLLVFWTQASFGFFVGSISRSIFRSSCPLNLNILLLVHILPLTADFCRFWSWLTLSKLLTILSDLSLNCLDLA